MEMSLIPKINHRLPIIGGIMIGLFMLDCKPAKQAEVKTLNNFAANSEGFEKSICRGTDDAIQNLNRFLPLNHVVTFNKDTQENHVDVDAAKAVLAAIPASVLTFFTATGGRITFDINDGKEICSPAPLKSETERSGTVSDPTKNELPNSCWKQIGYGKATRTVLWINPTTGLEHGTVQAFGHIFAEIYLKFKFHPEEMNPGSSGAIFTARDPADKDRGDMNFLEALADKFKADVTGRTDKKYNLDAYKELIAKPADAIVAAYFVFGEAFDSRYCSDRTREMARSDFSATMTKFEEFDYAFGQWGDKGKESKIGKDILAFLNAIDMKDGFPDWEKFFPLKEKQAVPEKTGMGLYAVYQPGNQMGYPQDNWQYQNGNGFDNCNQMGFQPGYNIPQQCGSGFRNQGFVQQDYNNSWQWNSRMGLPTNQMNVYGGYQGYGGMGGYGTCAGGMGNQNFGGYDMNNPYGFSGGANMGMGMGMNSGCNMAGGFGNTFGSMLAAGLIITGRNNAANAQAIKALPQPGPATAIGANTTAVNGTNANGTTVGTTTNQYGTTTTPSYGSTTPSVAVAPVVTPPAPYVAPQPAYTPPPPEPTPVPAKPAAKKDTYEIAGYEVGGCGVIGISDVPTHALRLLNFLLVSLPAIFALRRKQDI
jgi:hypothetical protein